MVRPSLSILVALSLGACAVVPAAPKPKPTTAPSAATTATAKPVAALLQKPTGASRLVKGTLALDPAYVQAVNAGSLVSPNGGTVISGNGSGVISGNGSTILAPNGGGLIAPNGGQVLAMGQLKPDGAGGLISQDGASIVAQGAGNIIAPNGGTVISSNGSAILAPNGGGIVAQGAGNRHLTATSTPVQLPAAGMLLQAVRLGVDQPLALGTDAEGHPVYAIYTNATGHFEIYLPVTESANVHLRAIAPNLDARLVYDHVGSPGEAEEVAIDEDSAQASRYLLGAFRGKLAAILAAPNIDDPAFRAQLFEGTPITAAMSEFLWPVAHDFIDKVKAAGIPPARYGEVADHAAAALLRTAKLKEILVDRVNTHYEGTDPNETCFQALVAVFKQAREQVAALGTPDQAEAYFAKQDYMVKANQERSAKGLAPFKIRKASDVGDFLVERYFSKASVEDINAAAPVLWSLHPNEVENHSVSVLNHLYAAASGAGLALAVTFVQDEAARQEVYAAIAAMATTARP